MNQSDAGAASNFLRHLPSVDELLRTSTGTALIERSGRQRVTSLARRVIASLRTELQANGPSATGEDMLAVAERRLILDAEAERRSGLTKVINATGVIVHTNLGRAPLSEMACRAIVEAAGYSTVEYDLDSGSRGRRGAGAEALICEMTGAEAALVVNNCAAAAFLIVSVFASGGEAIVSRGELVEIGGDFRIPDVLERSGTRLREVGTTNRTRLADYERAINENTRMIMKVHPSNYRIVGFAASVTTGELAALARSRNILLYEDAGSGALFDLKPFGLTNEPIISESIAAGVDLVTFSGDKLLGGPQAGIIAGKQDLVERIRKHPLYRALRVDKLIYAALEATLSSFVDEKAAHQVPVLRMLSMSKQELGERADRFVSELGEAPNLIVEVIEGVSAVGGGASPDFQPETVLIAVNYVGYTVEKLEYLLRRATPPVIARIAEGKLLIDLRTVAEDEENELIQILRTVGNE